MNVEAGKKYRDARQIQKILESLVTIFDNVEVSLGFSSSSGTIDVLNSQEILQRMLRFSIGA